MCNDNFRTAIISTMENSVITTAGIHPEYIMPYILGKQIKLHECSTKDLHQEIFEMTNIILQLSIELSDIKKKIEELHYRRGVSY